MSHPSSQQYLDGKVLSASQPRLHLMLLEGALRFGRQAKQFWSDGKEFGEIDMLLVRVADILDELTRSVSESDEEIAKQLEEQYAFLYRELAACRINQSPEKLGTCLDLLEYERETWLQVCKQLEAASASSDAAGVPHLDMGNSISPQGLSLEA